MQYNTIDTQNVACVDRAQRIAFVERFLNLPKNEFGGFSYWPIFVSHGGGYVEPRQEKEVVIYFYEGEILRKERRSVSEHHNGTMEFIFWSTKKFTFQKDRVVIEEVESSSHVDGTDEGFPKKSKDNFGSQGFGRWNDDSTGMWDWD